MKYITIFAYCAAMSFLSDSIPPDWIYLFGFAAGCGSMVVGYIFDNLE